MLDVWERMYVYVCVCVCVCVLCGYTGASVDVNGFYVGCRHVCLHASVFVKVQ